MPILSFWNTSCLFLAWLSFNVIYKSRRLTVRRNQPQLGVTKIVAKSW
jgi:hypothetical protein